jgi:hypothetical protein
VDERRNGYWEAVADDHQGLAITEARLGLYGRRGECASDRGQGRGGRNHSSSPRRSVRLAPTRRLAPLLTAWPGATPACLQMELCWQPSRPKRVRGISALMIAVATLGILGMAGCGGNASATSGLHLVTTTPPKKVPCDQIDIIQPNWQQPADASTQVTSVAAARRVSHLPIVAPGGLGTPAAIFAQPHVARFVFHGKPNGDVVVTEARPDLPPADWQQELRVVPAQNGKPLVTGTASVVRVGPGVRALQSVSPCISGSTTDWHTRDGRMEIAIDGRTLRAAAGARAARLTEQATEPH